MGNLAQRLAKKLRELRGEATQVHFARRLGISKSSLNRIEIGDQNVSLRTLEKLCARLHCDVADLFPKGQRSPSVGVDSLTRFS